MAGGAPRGLGLVRVVVGTAFGLARALPVLASAGVDTPIELAGRVRAIDARAGSFRRVTIVAELLVAVVLVGGGRLMAAMTAHGIGVDLPAGWDGHITVRHDGSPLSIQAASGTRLAPLQSRPVVHLASFGLPKDRGDFGSGAVELMGDDDVFIVLFEHEPAAVDTALFRSSDRPTRAPAPRLRTADVAAGDPRPDRVPTFLPRGWPGLVRVRGARLPHASGPPRPGRQPRALLAAVRCTRGRIASDAMGAWAGPFLVAAVLLAAAGFAKAVRPDDTVGALRAMGIRVPPFVVRVGGGAEALVAVGAGLTGTPVLAGVVACSYAAFAAFVVVALGRRLPISSCGCFGRVDTPPTVLHVVLDLGAAVSAAVVAARDGGGVVTVLRDQPLAGVPFLLLVATGAYAALTAMTVLPRVARLGVERS